MAIFYTDSASFDNITVTQNLTVLGTSSATYTQDLVVESNTIKLGNSQILRYAGVEFVDSGSTPITSASLLFDSTNNQIIYQHNGGLTSSVFLLGPETYNNLGNETYLTTNRLPKGTGIEHLVDSNITDTGTLVSIVGPLSASGGITGSGFLGTSSFAVSASWAPSVSASYAETASFAVSASWAPGGEQGAAFPFTGSAAISGSLDVVDGENTRIRILGQSTGSVPLTGTLLQVVASSSVPTRISVDTHNNDNAFGSSIRARRSRGTITNPTAIQSGDVLMQVVGDGYDGTAYQTNQMNIAFLADENWSGTNRGTVMSIRNTPVGSTTSTASMNIRSDRVDITGSLGTTRGLFVGSQVPLRTPNEAVGIYPSASGYNLVVASASVNDYLQFNLINSSTGNTASADFVATNDLGANSETGFYVNMGINSSGHSHVSPNSLGRANDAYLYTITSGSLLIGNAGNNSGSNVAIFAGKGLIDNSLTASIFISSSGTIGINTSTPRAALEVSGSMLQQTSLLIASGTIAAPGGTTVNLNLNNSNYFIVSASSTGTVTWQVTGIATSSAAFRQAQSFIVQYTNGGVVTNTWFTNTRWSGGTAPTLTTGTAPDLLGFVTDDSGSNWRGVLLQRASA